MAESIKSVIPIISQAGIKKADGSDIKSDEFEALLAALIGQSLNFQGNISASEVCPLSLNADTVKSEDLGMILYGMQTDSNMQNASLDVEPIGLMQLEEDKSINTAYPFINMLSKINSDQEQSDILNQLDSVLIKASISDSNGYNKKVVSDSNVKGDIKEAPIIKTLINKAFVDYNTQNDIKSNTRFLAQSGKDSSVADNKVLENTYEANNNSKALENAAGIFDAFLNMSDSKNGIKQNNVNSYSILSAKDENTDAIKVELTSKQINSEESAKTDKKNDTLPERQAMYKDSFMQVLNNTNLHEKVHQNAVIDTKQIVESNKESILNQIYDKIKVINGKDYSELHVSLKPDGLGEVAIKLLMDKGSMVGKIIVDNNHVKELIESNLPQIKENLRNGNVNVSSLSVSVGVNQDSFLNHKGFSNNGKMRLRSSSLKQIGKSGFNQTMAESVSIGVLNLLV